MYMLNLFVPCGGLLAEGCCWYIFFSWMGCIDGEVEQIQTQRPQPPPAPNPFVHTGVPKDNHLQNAYG